MANPNGGLMITPQLIQSTPIKNGVHRHFNEDGKTYVSVSKDALQYCDTIEDRRKLLAGIVNNTIYHWEHKYEVELDGIYDRDWELVFEFTLQERVY